MKKLLRLGLFILLAYLFLRLGGSMLSAPPAAELGLLLNRPWIAHLPKDDRDLVPHLFLFQKSKLKGGVFGVASAWRIETNLVRYRYEAPVLDLELPQRGVKGRLTVHIDGCKEAPKPLDLCLSLSEGSRTLRLYSRRSWRVEGERAAGFEDSPFERQLASFVETTLGGPTSDLGEGAPLEDAPEKLLFPGR